LKKRITKEKKDIGNDLRERRTRTRNGRAKDRRVGQRR